MSGLHGTSPHRFGRHEQVATSTMVYAYAENLIIIAILLRSASHDLKVAFQPAPWSPHVMTDGSSQRQADQYHVSSLFIYTPYSCFCCGR